jgi:hypothetical protein
MPRILTAGIGGYSNSPARVHEYTPTIKLFENCLQRNSRLSNKVEILPSKSKQNSLKSHDMCIAGECSYTLFSSIKQS